MCVHLPGTGYKFVVKREINSLDQFEQYDKQVVTSLIGSRYSWYS